MDILSLAQEFKANIVSDNGVYLILYEPYFPPKQSEIFIDSYYAAYQRVRKRKWALKERLNGYVVAEPTRPYKDILEADGCFKGKNTICIHPEYGTLFAVEIIELLDFDFPVTKRAATDSCGECRLCLDACPTKALTEKGFNRDICIRQLQDEGFIENEKLAKLLGNKVLGCNECQKVCPKNHYDLVSPTVDATFFDDCVKGKKAMEKYVDILGRNYLRPVRFIVNCINAFINNGDYSRYETIKGLIDHPDERVRKAANRFLKNADEAAWEWELKYLIEENEQVAVSEKYPSEKQVNYYFKSNIREDYARIREKGETFEFTYKFKRSDGKGRIELNKTVTAEFLKTSVDGGITSEKVKELCGVDIGDLSYIGNLITYRSTYQENGLKIEVDKNEYLGVVDYEVEAEVKSEEEFCRAKEYLTTKFTCRESVSKTKRFLAALEKDKK